MNGEPGMLSVVDASSCGDAAGFASQVFTRGYVAHQAFTHRVFLENREKRAYMG